MSGARRGPVVAKQKWTEEEEAALRAGVEKYDVGKWRHIQKDEVFGPVLKSRSNVDLKDKWRNLNMDSSGSRRDGRSSDKNGKKRKRRRADIDTDLELDDDEEYVLRRASYSTSRRRSLRRNLAKEAEAIEEEEEDQTPIHDVSLDNILAAMIQLQDPEGYTEDTLCSWLQENYNIGPDCRESVRDRLGELVEAGKVVLAKGLYTLTGFPQQLIEESRKFTGYEADGGYFSRNPANAKVGWKLQEAREAAEAAAKAVQEAEEAAEQAAELIAAADQYQREAHDESPETQEALR